MVQTRWNAYEVNDFVPYDTDKLREGCKTTLEIQTDHSLPLWQQEQRDSYPDTMVVIQIKTSDQDSFLYETTCDTTNDALVRDITRVWNMRLRLEQLTGALREMAKYGPMKHPNKAGLDEVSETYNGEIVEKGAYYQPDPTGARTGNGVGPQLSETIERVVLDTESALSQVIKC